jgi:hypothetical protein
MTSARDQLARFIQSEGHRVEMTLAADDDKVAELLFRSRGSVLSVQVREGDSPSFQIATAYEIPTWARERAQNANTLRDVATGLNNVRFTLASNGKNFAATLDCGAMTLEAFQRDLWSNVARVREAGIAAIERILDRSESHAAADKFIRSLQRGFH